MLDTLELFLLFLLTLALLARLLGLWLLPLAQGRAPACVATADRWLLRAFGLKPDAQEGWRDYARFSFFTFSPSSFSRRSCSRRGISQGIPRDLRAFPS